MIVTIVKKLAVCFVLGMTATLPAKAQIIRSVDFSTSPNPITLSHDGVEVTLQPIFEEKGDVEVITSIRAPGYQTVIVREGYASSASFERVVSIGKLGTADPISSVLLGGFTGGAHCCATLRVITPSAGKLKVLDFEAVDGGPSTTFPTDLDGDGTSDFERQDDSFRYQFASGAGSVSPPIILNIYKGQIVNVSDQPAFAPLWKTFAAKTRLVCADQKNDDRNGACIAYVAAGARLGKFAEFMQEAVKHAYTGASAQLPKRCETELVNFVCPAGKEIKFYTFETAANWFLRRQGYIE